MAQYTRFEIYIPLVYKTLEPDPSTGKERQVVHTLSEEHLRQFVNETSKKYGGITQANPIDPALFKGWWKSEAKGRIEADYLTYLFGLVRIDQSDEAVRFFGKWKQRFESIAHQEVLLIIYHPVQTIGDFF